MFLRKAMRMLLPARRREAQPRSNFRSAATRVLLVASLLVAAVPTLASDVDARVDHAMKFASGNLVGKIRNMSVVFHWIGATDRFWFRKTLADDSVMFVVVDASTGRQAPLFDNSDMSAALRAAGALADASISDITVAPDGRTLEVAVAKADAPCRWPTAPTCRKPTISYACDLPITRCKLSPKPLGDNVKLSPDGRQIAFARDHNLWVKDIASGRDRQLTTDGVEHFAYGDTHNHMDYARVERRRAGSPEPLDGVQWSPDGRYILVIRHDVRAVRAAPVVTEYLPPEGGRPRVHYDRLAIAADARYPGAILSVIDVRRGTVRRTAAESRLFDNYATNFYFRRNYVRWSNGGRVAWLHGIPRDGRELHLLRIDVESGTVRDVITERSETPISGNDFSVSAPNLAVSRDGKELIWFSQRDGWGHLYLHDAATGRVKRQITKGAYVVTNLLRFDEEQRKLYFVAVGREHGRNIYHRHLYSIGLDGGEPVLLSPERADHQFDGQTLFWGAGGGSISPSGRYLIDVFSTSVQPDKVVLRGIDGRFISDVVEADIARLRATGWRPPEPFSVKAADGTTDLHGVMFKPIDFDPAKTYPIIEITYPGPTLKFSPTTFADNFLATTTLNAHAFAETGAIVVGFDGRGGGFRSVKFRTAFLGTDDFMGAADHVAAVRNLALRHPFIDLGRVGLTGHSNGGYASLRAMLLFPAFYKVVVSGEGVGDWLTASADVATERVLGVPDTPAKRAYYHRISNESLAHRLDGKLLMIFAGADEGVPLQNAFQLFKAFEKANKVYDTLIMPDAPHYGGREPYGVMRTVRYFAENLGGSR